MFTLLEVNNMDSHIFTKTLETGINWENINWKPSCEAENNWNLLTI